MRLIKDAHKGAGIITLMLIIVIGVVFDYYYEFNDDVLMKDIMSGVYSGIPSGLNMQTLAPLGIIISLFYKLAPNVPWYGGFLCLCHYVCIFILFYRALRVSETKRIRSRLVIMAIGVLFIMGFLLPHLVMVQYTVTVAILTATAAFIFYTIPYNLDDKKFARQVIPVVLIAWLAFMVRSEMFLLLLPYVAITGLARWNREKSMADKQTVRRYMLVVVAIAVCMAVSLGLDKLAYSSDDWRSFRNEFDNRTQLYDYQYVPPYEQNAEFYDSCGISEAEVNLLSNYNYGIDNRIDGNILGQVAEYADGLRNESLGYKCKRALQEYIYRVTHFTDGAYAFTVFFLYVMLIWAILARKESSTKHKLHIIGLRACGLFFMRSVSWLYIIMGHRAPDRIVHSLYIVEIIILFSQLLVEFTSKLREGRYIQFIASITLIVGGIVLSPLTMIEVRSHVSSQDVLNRNSQAIDGYCKEHPDNFYFEDVYSTIIDGETTNEKMFVDVDVRIKNYDLIGGWICNSPLYRDKLSRYGIKDVTTDLVDKDNVYVIISDDYDEKWISSFYDSIERSVTINRVDTINASSRNYGVYKVSDV